MDLNLHFDSKIIDNAIQKGINYLWSKNENSRWSGFPTLAGESDVWVSGFVLAHIHHLSDCKDNIQKTQQFLLDSRQPLGGWSYSAIVPPDADSTSWCLMALELCLTNTGTCLEQARTFLWSHLISSGISTFSQKSAIVEFIAAEAGMPVSGWTSPHADVSIVAVLADIENENVPKIIAWLIEEQAKVGLLNSYWWRGPFYTTALLLRALSIKGYLLPKKDARYTISSLINRQLTDGGFSLGSPSTMDAFSTALALESFCHLSYLGHKKEKSMCGKALLQSQKEDGSWAGGFTMQIPAPDVVDPQKQLSWSNADGGGNSFIEDKDGLFATAMACYALDRFKHEESKGIPPKTELEYKNYGLNTDTF